MSKLDNFTRLQHLRQAAAEAIEFVAECNRDTLKHDRKLVLALVKEIEIIGEAAAGLSADCRERHPQIPWTDMIGMRNRLVHAYFDVDINILWDTVTLSLPMLLIQLEQVILAESSPAN